MIKAADGKVYAADSKVVIDNNSLFRHKDIAQIRDILEEGLTEAEASRYDLNFVKLDGNVGCMVNGANLAMAAMNMIKMSGGDPVNFLDVWGTADAKRVEQAFRIILKDESVKAILVNILGGFFIFSEHAKLFQICLSSGSPAGGTWQAGSPNAMVKRIYNPEEYKGCG